MLVGPHAVFLNDATIPDRAPTVRSVGCWSPWWAPSGRLNALDSDELGTDDPVSRVERATLRRLRDWAGRKRRLA